MSRHCAKQSCLGQHPVRNGGERLRGTDRRSAMTTSSSTCSSLSSPGTPRQAGREDASAGPASCPPVAALARTARSRSANQRGIAAAIASCSVVSREAFSSSVVRRKRARSAALTALPPPGCSTSAWSHCRPPAACNHRSRSAMKDSFADKGEAEQQDPGRRACQSATSFPQPPFGPHIQRST